MVEINVYTIFITLQLCLTIKNLCISRSDTKYVHKKQNNDSNKYRNQENRSNNIRLVKSNVVSDVFVLL